MVHPYRVGLTGGIGAGKSSVTAMFSQLGVPVVDADQIARDVVEPGKPAFKKILRLFGDRILSGDGRLSRDVLREIVFTDDDLRAQLESIIHPLVYEEMNTRVKKIRFPYCILSIPLLLETAARDKVDTVLVVDASESTRLERVSNRDKVSGKHVQDIIKAQVSREDRLKAADDVIFNDGNLDQLTDQVNDLHLKYLATANKSIPA